MARVLDAFTQFFDGNGDPLVSGKLYFYESGTNNTDKATYADISESIPNTNPVILDGEGRCPNVFGTGAYNIVSTSSDDIQIQQFDPVIAGQDAGAFAPWNSASVYAEGDIVTASDGKYYRSLVASNQNQDPTTSPDKWEELKFIGVWNTNSVYEIDDIVVHNGLLYESLTDANTGNTPAGDPTNWSQMGGATGGGMFYENGQTVTADYTLTTGKNAMTAGPISIATGVTVTVPTGQTWTIVQGIKMAITINGSTGIDAPALTLDTPLATAEGGTGQDSVKPGLMAQSTAIDTTSGTSHDFTGIPSWVKKITLMLSGVSTNGTSFPIIQVGDSGGIETTGYLGRLCDVNTAGAAFSSSFNLVTDHAATNVLHGIMVLSLLDSASNTWSMSTSISRSDATNAYTGAGSKALSGVLDRIRLTTVGGTDTFDAGKINILYEGFE